MHQKLIEALILRHIGEREREEREWRGVLGKHRAYYIESRPGPSSIHRIPSFCIGGSLSSAERNASKRRGRFEVSRKREGEREREKEREREEPKE